MKVKAAVARSRGGPLQLEGLMLAEPAPDEILVKLVASGVSRVDLAAIDGRLAMPLPFVPGCEGAGIVERVGDTVEGLAPGDAVVVSFDYCGHCVSCAAGRPHTCVDFDALNLSGRRLDGEALFTTDKGGNVNGRFFGQSSFATHLVCRAARAIKVETGAPLEVYACLGGEFLLGAGLVLHGFDLREGDSLVVVGADAIGLAAVTVAKARGATTIVVADPQEHRRTLASTLGATVTVHDMLCLSDLVRSVEAEGARFALDTTGTAEARQACLGSLTRGGTCAMVDLPADAPHDFDDQAGEGNLLVVSVDGHAPPGRLIRELTELRTRNALPLEALIDFFPFEHVNDALDALRRGQVAKPVLRFSLGGFGELDRALTEGAAVDTPQDAPQDEPTPETVGGDDQLVRS